MQKSNHINKYRQISDPADRRKYGNESMTHPGIQKDRKTLTMKYLKIYFAGMLRFTPCCKNLEPNSNAAILIPCHDSPAQLSYSSPYRHVNPPTSPPTRPTSPPRTPPESRPPTARRSKAARPRHSSPHRSTGYPTPLRRPIRYLGRSNRKLRNLKYPQSAPHE